MVYLPHRNYKNSIWKWSRFHLKKLAESKKFIKNCILYKIEKKKT